MPFFKKPTSHSALEGLGFGLAEEHVDDGPRTGKVTRRHYTLTQNNPGLVPTTHHVYLNEYGSHPGEYDLNYGVTQGSSPYAYSGGRFDKAITHKTNSLEGSSDPIADVIDHHKTVIDAIGGLSHRDLRRVAPEEIHRLYPGMEGWSGYKDEGNGFSTRTLKRLQYPKYNLESLSSVPGEPLDMEVHRRMTNGANGPRFSYEGRYPGEPNVDVYHQTHRDPQNPLTFQYDVTVLHNKDMESPFFYSVKRRQSGIDGDGNEDTGSSVDVTGDSYPVAKLGTINQLVRRHNDVMRALGIMKPSKTSGRDASIMDQADEDLRP